MIDFFSRLDKYMKHKGLNDNKITIEASVSNGLIGKGRKRGSLSQDNISKILCTYSDLSADWLLTGRGDMLKNDLPVVYVDVKEKFSLHGDRVLDGQMVPVYNFDAVGGMDVSNEITDTPAYIERYVPFVDSREGDICVHVTGNSMVPTYSPGSLVLVREVFNWRDYFGYGHCFVLFLNDGRRILKEIRKSEIAPMDNVLCVSHNPSVPAEELPKGIIKKVYKVIMALTKEGF